MDLTQALSVVMPSVLDGTAGEYSEKAALILSRELAARDRSS
jgi:hypothetical protein